MDKAPRRPAAITHPPAGQETPPAQATAGRLIAALPDAATAAVLLWVWIDPVGWRKGLVGDGLLIMLVEFILIHSAPFLGAAVFAYDQPVKTRLKTVGGMGLLYSLFIAAFSWQFRSWWPAAMFAWLLGAKFAGIILNRREPETAKLRQQGLWGASVAYYLLSVFATLLLPVPKLGITHHGHFYGIPGSGEWVSHPHMVISAGFIYFTLLALTKLRGWDAAWGRAAQRQQNKQS